MSALCHEAVRAVLDSAGAFCKFIAPNDCGATRSHQSGILISVSAWDLLFPGSLFLGAAGTSVLKRPVRILWQNGQQTDSRFTYYNSKKELRVTGFGRGFGLLSPERLGSLFVLCRRDTERYSAFFLDTEGDIDEFLEAFALSAADTNRMIDAGAASVDVQERVRFDEYLAGIGSDFPGTAEISEAARRLCAARPSTPDGLLLEWIRTEYALFRAMENERYGTAIQDGFDNIDAFLDFAKTVLNRRKSRAGKSLENHLARLFEMHGLRFDTQAVTEDGKRPDFLFPSRVAYQDPSFPVEKLVTMGAKTTCKDRWRQIITEADRLRDRPKFLCTLQQGNSATQLREMAADNVVLVVPAPYKSAYPPEWRDRIWSLQEFIEHVLRLQGGAL